MDLQRPSRGRRNVTIVDARHDVGRSRRLPPCIHQANPPVRSTGDRSLAQDNVHPVEVITEINVNSRRHRDRLLRDQVDRLNPLLAQIQRDGAGADNAASLPPELQRGSRRSYPVRVVQTVKPPRASSAAGVEDLNHGRPVEPLHLMSSEMHDGPDHWMVVPESHVGNPDIPADFILYQGDAAYTSARSYRHTEDMSSRSAKARSTSSKSSKNRRARTFPMSANSNTPDRPHLRDDRPLEGESDMRDWRTLF